MSTLTRRDRLARGANQGGAMYYGSKRRWPEHAPYVFELFATHPYTPARPVYDRYGHSMTGLTLWDDGSGIEKFYMGYGHISVEVPPIYVVPLNLNGTWDATVFEFNAYAIRYFHHDAGKMYAVGWDGPFDYLYSTPRTGTPATWTGGWCSPYGYNHPCAITVHDGWIWICGQTGASGSVWRTRLTDHPWGNDGQFVLLNYMPAGASLNRPQCLFSFQGKLWYQDQSPGATTHPLLRYWVEATQSWTFTNVNLNDGAVGEKIVQRGSVMLMACGPDLVTFNGTTKTTVYNIGGSIWDPKNIAVFDVDPDDNVWVMDDDGYIHTSSDLVDWEIVAQFPDPGYSLLVRDNYMYVGDTHDNIWRTRIVN